MAELRALPGIPARALEFTILTAARTGEARFARWSEVDLRAGVWTIPGERMKGDKEHRVPLSDRALAILAELPRESGSDAVFPGRSAGGFLNQDAMADVLAKLRPGITVHGFRSTFRDWAAETTAYPEPRPRNGAGARDLERCRGRLPARRPVREAAAADEEWAAFCGQRTERTAAEVVPLRA